MGAKKHDINVLHKRGRLICSRGVVYTRTVVRGNRHILSLLVKNIVFLFTMFSNYEQRRMKTSLHTHTRARASKHKHTHTQAHTHTHTHTHTQI